jgi:hypothetical protein
MSLTLSAEGILEELKDPGAFACLKLWNETPLAIRIS